MGKEIPGRVLREHLQTEGLVVARHAEESLQRSGVLHA
jgi:hypothetical protein